MTFLAAGCPEPVGFTAARGLHGALFSVSRSSQRPPTIMRYCHSHAPVLFECHILPSA